MAVVGVWSLEPIWDADFWWHLAGGRWMWEHREVLRADPFTSTVSGRAWLDHEWLFQLLLYASHRLADIRGVLLFKAALLAAAAFGFSKSLGRGVPAWLNAAIVLALGWCLGFRNMARAELISLCLFPFFVWGLFEFKGRRPWVWLLPVLTALWANAHPGFCHGLALIFIGALASVLRREGRGEVSAWLALGASCGLAALLNPYGLGLYATIFEWTGRLLEGAGSVLTELAPVPLDRYPFFWIGLALAWGACGLKSWKSRAIDYWSWGLLAYATWMGPRFVRNIPFALMIAAPVAVRCFDLQAPLKRAGRFLNPAAALLCAVLLAAGCRRARWGVDAAKFPAAAADFLLSARPEGRGYNDYNLGNYLTWAFYGSGLKVFLDGRLSVEGYYEVWREMIAARTPSPESLEAWKALVERWDVQWCLMEIPSYRIFYEGRPVSIFAYYFPSARWALVYRDAKTALYVRRGGGNEKLIARAELARVYPDIASNDPVRAPWAALWPKTAR